jgi:hypothetical protein
MGNAKIPRKYENNVYGLWEKKKHPRGFKSTPFN